MNKLKLIASSLLMASMLTAASFSMQATPDFIDPNFQPSLMCARPTNDFSTIKAGVQLASLITEVKASEDDQNPKYSWMRSEDRNQFDMIMGRTGAIGGHGWNEIVDKLITTQKWLANQEIEARYAILYKNITEVSQMAGMSSVSLRPEKYNVLSSGDISEFNSLLMSGSTTLKTIEKLSIAEQWWNHVDGQYGNLDGLLGSLDYDSKALLNSTTRNPEFSWMTQEDHAAFADARTGSMCAGMDSISDMYISQIKVSEKNAAYTHWLVNRKQFRADTIALEQFSTNMSAVELEAFNAAKSSMTYTMTNDISDMHNSTKSPAEKLAIYTQWLGAYRQNQASLVALEQFSVGMSEAEQEAFSAAKATYSMTNDISDMYISQKSPTEKLAVYTQWLTAYRQAN